MNQKLPSTVYYVYTQIIGHKPVLLNRNQLVRYFANSDVQQYFVSKSWSRLDPILLESLNNHQYENAYVGLHVKKLVNPTELYFTRDQFNVVELYYKCRFERELNQGELINLILDAQEFYRQFEATEVWDGQANYLKMTNEFGRTIKVPVKDVIINARVPFSFKNAKSHSNKFQFKSKSRANHDHSCFAKSNHLTVLHANVDSKYNHNLRHFNRNYVKKHPSAFPIWDDNEYMTSRRSNGWKHQKKNRHQYDAPIKAHQDTSSRDSIKSLF